MDLAGRLAQYALSTKFSQIDQRSLKETKARVIDALGCGLGAFGERPVKFARRGVRGLNPKGGKSTLLGTQEMNSPDLATFVNGLMVRYFDFNDTYLSKEPAHPSDNLAPCLAVAEAEDAGGKALTAALVTAYEVQCRLCDAADIRHRGWDHVNYGLVSAALASAKLMGLGAGKAAQAVNIALSGHIAMRQVRAGELSMWKGASFANAARNSVFAAYLAREGVTGPSPIFEGEMGFFKQVSGAFELDTEKFGGGRRRFKISDTYVKYWPAEYHAQTAIWAAMEVRAKVKDPGEAESVLVETHEAGFTILGKDPEKWHPRTRETADHSLPFMVGMALLKGKVDVSSYSEANLRDPKVLGFLKKVRVREDPRLTAMYPARGMPNRVSLAGRDGRMFASEVVVPRGHPMNPMSKKDIEAKFLRLATRALGRKGANLALRTLWRLEEVREVREVMPLLVARAGAKA